MRTKPENPTLVAFFKDEKDLVKVWNEDFPVKKGDWVRAKHINALWAALTERGRIVGLQVHDWTVGTGVPGSEVAGPGSGSGERRWNYPVHGAVRPDDEQYWDGFIENTNLIEADEVEAQHISDILQALLAVCTRYANPETGRGFLGIGDLIQYANVSEVITIVNDHWSIDEWTNETDIVFNNYGFPVVPDRTAKSNENQFTADQQKAFREERFYYNRFQPGSWHKEIIEINDPRFSINGGGFGPAQSHAWIFAQEPTLPPQVPVIISSANKGEPIPSTDEDTINVPLPFFHEHINSIYYMIRALEHYPYVYSEFPDPLGHILQVSGGEVEQEIQGTSFCLPGRSGSPEKQAEEWVQYCTKQVEKAMSNSAASIGGGVLSGDAWQGSRYFCPSPPVGLRTWDCVNFRRATFIPFVPKWRPWDNPEASLFPGGFSSVYRVPLFRLWLQGNYNTFTRRDNVSAGAGGGWGGTAHLRYEPGPFVPPSTSNHFGAGAIIHSIMINGNITNFTSSDNVSASGLPNTIGQFALDEFSLHFDLDPGKWGSLNTPVNKPPRVVSSGEYTNLTASEISMQAKVATKIENHLYFGGRVAAADVEL